MEGKREGSGERMRRESEGEERGKGLIVRET